jgi:hypothetical protein
MLPISSSEGEGVDASRDIANPVAVPNFHQRALEDRIEEDNISPGYYRIHLPPQTSPDNTTPLAYIEKRRADLNQLECMRERVRLLEQDLRVGSSSTEPGVSCLHGLPTGAQHPALPFEEHSECGCYESSLAAQSL